MIGDLRVGQGFDVHAFAAGRKLILGGVEIPFERGLVGHSDADVLLHALTDGFLGALGWDDIGEWFPDTDPRWAGASSEIFLKAVWDKAQAEGWRLVNCDCSILAERPKLRQYIPQMRQRIADLLGVAVSRISIKATTTEHLGFIGREEGILSSAVVLLLSESV